MGDYIYKNMPLWDFFSSPSSSYIPSGAPGTTSDEVAAAVIAVFFLSSWLSAAALSVLTLDGVGLTKDLTKALAFYSWHNYVL